MIDHRTLTSSAGQATRESNQGLRGVGCLSLPLPPMPTPPYPKMHPAFPFLSIFPALEELSPPPPRFPRLAASLPWQLRRRCVAAGCLLAPAVAAAGLRLHHPARVRSGGSLSPAWERGRGRGWLGSQRGGRSGKDTKTASRLQALLHCASGQEGSLGQWPSSRPRDAISSWQFSGAHLPPSRRGPGSISW